MCPCWHGVIKRPLHGCFDGTLNVFWSKVQIKVQQHVSLSLCPWFQEHSVKKEGKKISRRYSFISVLIQSVGKEKLTYIFWLWIINTISMLIKHKHSTKVWYHSWSKLMATCVPLYTRTLIWGQQFTASALHIHSFTYISELHVFSTNT